MSHTLLQNKAGEFVAPSVESFSAAGEIDWSKEAGFNKVLTDSETKGAWPIASATFILVHKNPQNPEQVANVLKFFDWAYQNGDESAVALDYVPFGDGAVTLFKDSWKEIKDGSGQPVFK